MSFIPLGFLAASGSVAGDFQSIQTVTVGAGGASYVEFTSIPSTFKHIQIRASLQSDRATYGTTTFKLIVNNDTGSNYYNHSLNGSGSSAGVEARGGTSVEPGDVAGTGVSSAFGASVTDILDYANTDKKTTFRILGGIDINGTIAGSPGFVSLNSALWNNTAAITSLKLTPAHGTVWNQYSKIALYGVK